MDRLTPNEMFIPSMKLTKQLSLPSSGKWWGETMRGLVAEIIPAKHGVLYYIPLLALKSGKSEDP